MRLPWSRKPQPPAAPEPELQPEPRRVVRNPRPPRVPEPVEARAKPAQAAASPQTSGSRLNWAEHADWLREHYPTLGVEACAQALSEKLGREVLPTALRPAINRLRAAGVDIPLVPRADRAQRRLANQAAKRREKPPASLGEKAPRDAQATRAAAATPEAGVDQREAPAERSAAVAAPPAAAPPRNLLKEQRLDNAARAKLAAALPEPRWSAQDQHELHAAVVQLIRKFSQVTGKSEVFVAGKVICAASEEAPRCLSA